MRRLIIPTTIIVFASMLFMVAMMSVERRHEECHDLVVVMISEETSTTDMARALRDARCRVRRYLPLEVDS